jgi:hypothetical protein
MTMRTLLGTFLTPCFQTALFRLTSMRTSLVPIILEAKALISLIARGARFLKFMECSLLCRLTVYSLVTTSFERRSFFAICATSSSAEQAGEAGRRRGAHRGGGV